MTTAGGPWTDLLPRLLSGVLVAGIGLLCIWLGGFSFHFIVAVAAGIMVWELARMLGGSDKAIVLGTSAGVALFVGSYLSLWLALPLLVFPALIGASQLAANRALYSIFTALIVFAGLGMIGLRDDFGFTWMAWLVLVVIATDILGYFAGRFIGGPKFWPRVSPKKTWSGTVAGWIGAAIVGVIFMNLTGTGTVLIGISIAVAIASQIGDIAESALKRKMGVKDSSNILPGHGGLFDRFDGMLGAALFLLLLGQMIDFPPSVILL